MKIITDVACPACGCVCDDLRITCEGNRPVKIEPPCPLAERWYARIGSATPPPAEIAGHPVSREQAIAHAAHILAQAKSPLIYGLSRSSTAGQRAALAIADRIGATIDTTASLCHGPSIMALQQVGEATASLGEVRYRSDLVIFWGADPLQTHPRHLERYSGFPPSELLPRGRADRTIVVVDNEQNSLRSEADFFIPINPSASFEALVMLRGLLRDISSEDKAVPKSEHIAWPAELAAHQELWLRLLNQMISCKCGVIFFGLGLSQSSLGHLAVEQLLRMVSELNDHTHFYARRMRLHGDVSGADSILCWQTGYPFSVNLARGYPRYNPGEFSAPQMLARREADACLIIGSETISDFSPTAREELERIPTIVLDSPQVTPPFQPEVLLRSAVYGVHAPGTAYRMDEIPIPLRAFLESEYPTDAVILEEMFNIFPAEA